MNNTLLITRLTLRSSFKKPNLCDKREKRHFILMTSVIAFLVVAALTYLFGITYALTSLGLSDRLPTVLALLTSVILLAFGAFKAGSEVFSPHGTDHLASLPLSSFSISMGKVLALYLEDLALTIFVFLPSSTLLAVLSPLSPTYFLILIPLILALPVLPLALSLLVGTGIFAISSRFRHKTLVQTILSLVLVIGVMTFSFSLEGIAADLTPDQIKTLLQTALDDLTTTIPLFSWFENALQGDPFALLFFLALSLFAAALIALILTKSYFPLLHRLRAISPGKTAKAAVGKGTSPLFALIRREARHYFSSSIYVTNTILGPVFSLVLAIALAVVGADVLIAQIPIPLDLPALVPIALTAVLTMMLPVSCSISMERTCLPYLKSLPIVSRTVYAAKIAFSLLLISPFFLLSQIPLAIALTPSWYDFLLGIFLPTAIALFAATLSLRINLALPRLDAPSDTYIVKESAASMLGGFVGPLIAFVSIAPLLLLPAPYALALRIALISLFLALAFLVWRNIQKIDLIAY